MPLEMMNVLFQVNYLSILLRLALSLVCGGAIGLDREKNHQAAGLRTYIVVCVSSALIMITNVYLGVSVGNADLSRMSAGVVSGIGFLGAGTIIVTNRHQIRGLTTAAGLWGSAAIGSAFGAGLYVGGLMGFAMVFCSIHFVRPKEKRRSLEQQDRRSRLYAELEDRGAVSNLLLYLREHQMQISELELRRLRGGREVGLTFTLEQPNGRREFLELLEELMGQVEGLILLDQVE